MFLQMSVCVFVCFFVCLVVWFVYQQDCAKTKISTKRMGQKKPGPFQILGPVWTKGADPELFLLCPSGVVTVIYLSKGLL